MKTSEIDRIHFEVLRNRMIHDQIRHRGIENPWVLRALANVPREEFVQEDQQMHAYEDRSLPMGCGQMTSQPYSVALYSSIHS